MSVRAVREFYRQVEEDQALQEKIRAVSEKAKTSLENAVSELIELAAAGGFVFTEQELAEVRNGPPAFQPHKGPDDVDGVPYECTEATAWKGHPPDPHGCALLWGCGVQHPMYGGPHIPICTNRPV